jgi:hypothetical protein
MKEKTATIYVTDDGKEFLDKDEALFHESYLNFVYWYNSSRHNEVPDVATSEEVFQWLTVNRHFLKTII